MVLANSEGVFSFQCGWEVLFDSTWEAIPICKGWVQQWKPKEANKLYGSISASVPWSPVSSYGEKILIQISENPPGTVWLAVSSTSNWGLFDFGKNKRNIDKLLSAVTSVLASKGISATATAQPAMSATGAAPQEAVAPAPSSPPQQQGSSHRFCHQCGASLGPNSKFCVKCGAEVRSA
jgi:hypothetical protein